VQGKNEGSQAILSQETEMDLPGLRENPDAGFENRSGKEGEFMIDFATFGKIMQEFTRECRFINLSHPLAPSMPVWPGDPFITRTVSATISHDGFNLNQWSFGEHTGTHVGAPSHFLENGTMLDDLSATPIIAPLAVVDVRHLELEHRRDITVADVEQSITQSGPITKGSVIAIRAGWSSRWPDPAAIFEQDENGKLVYPGVTAELVGWLNDELEIQAIGTDTPGIDPGYDLEFNAGQKLAELGIIHLENMFGFKQVPPRGAWVIVTWMPLSGATGSPAHIWAMMPK